MHCAIFEPRRFAILLHLIRCGGRCESKAVLTALDIQHRASLAVHTRKLRDAGLIRTHRRKILVLTPEGRAPLDGIVKAIHGAERAARAEQRARDVLASVELVG